MMSLPPRPFIVSLPPNPQMTSGPLVPRMLSLPLVPVMVQPRGSGSSCGVTTIVTVAVFSLIPSVTV
jgi:hypothetical protein